MVIVVVVVVVVDGGGRGSARKREKLPYCLRQGTVPQGKSMYLG